MVTIEREHMDPGLTLVPIAGSAEVVLIDELGAVVNRWPFDVALERG